MFYDKYVELCAKRGMTPSAAAKEIGINKAAVSNWKHRKNGPSDITVQKIADYFGVPAGYLLGCVENSTDDVSFSDGSGFGGGAAVGAGFGNGTGYGGKLTNNIQEKGKAPTPEGERTVSDEDIKFALFGGDGDITDAMFDEVKRFARMVKLREEAEKKKE